MAAVIISFIVTLPVPLIFIGIGVWFQTSPPDRGDIGYKSKMSMLNNETWHAGQVIFGRFILKAGIICTAVCVICLLTELIAGITDEDKALMYILIGQTAFQPLMLLVSLPFTESRLKKIFTVSGKRRSR